MRLVTFTAAGAPRFGALDAAGESICLLEAAAEARSVPRPRTFARALPFLNAGPEAMESSRELTEWAFRERPEGVVQALADVRLATPVPRPGSVRDTMSFERHIVQATRRVLGRFGDLDALIERRLGARRSIAGRLN